MDTNVRRAGLRRQDGGRAGLHQGRARARGVGLGLAAPDREADDKPNDATLFDLLTEWAPDAAQRQRILVTNPEALYGFAKAA